MCAILMALTMTACSQTDGDEKTIKEIENLNEKWLSINSEEITNP